MTRLISLCIFIYFLSVIHGFTTKVLQNASSKLLYMSRDMTNQQNGCAPSKDSDQPGHPPSVIRVFACAQWVAKDPRFLHADSEDSDQTGRMPRVIWVFAGRTLILLVLPCRGSIITWNVFIPDNYTYHSQRMDRIPWGQQKTGKCGNVLLQRHLWCPADRQG